MTDSNHYSTSLKKYGEGYTEWSITKHLCTLYLHRKSSGTSKPYVDNVGDMIEILTAKNLD